MRMHYNFTRKIFIILPIIDKKKKIKEEKIRANIKKIYYVNIYYRMMEERCYYLMKRRWQDLMITGMNITPHLLFFLVGRYK